MAGHSFKDVSVSQVGCDKVKQSQAFSSRTLAIFMGIQEEFIHQTCLQAVFPFPFFFFKIQQGDFPGGPLVDT